MLVFSYIISLFQNFSVAINTVNTDFCLSHLIKVFLIFTVCMFRVVELYGRMEMELPKIKKELSNLAGSRASLFGIFLTSGVLCSSFVYPGSQDKPEYVHNFILLLLFSLSQKVLHSQVQLKKRHTFYFYFTFYIGVN